MIYINDISNVTIDLKLVLPLELSFDMEVQMKKYLC
jgi:hypothetical protein